MWTNYHKVNDLPQSYYLTVVQFSSLIEKSHGTKIKVLAGCVPSGGSGRIHLLASQVSRGCLHFVAPFCYIEIDV